MSDGSVNDDDLDEILGEPENDKDYWVITFAIVTPSGLPIASYDVSIWQPEKERLVTQAATIGVLPFLEINDTAGSRQFWYSVLVMGFVEATVDQRRFDRATRIRAQIRFDTETKEAKRKLGEWDE